MDPAMLDLDLTLGKLAQRLDALGIVYAYTGGLAAITYGHPRTTQDVDLILEIDPWSKETAYQLAEQFADEFMFSIEGCLEGIEEQTMFQAIDLENMFKVDFHLSNIVPDSLDRIRQVKIPGGRMVPIVSPEDSILSKLVWIKKGSGRSKQDVVAMLRIQTELDTEYLDATAKKLGVDAILEKMRQIADRNDPHEIY